MRTENEGKEENAEEEEEKDEEGAGAGQRSKKRKRKRNKTRRTGTRREEKEKEASRAHERKASPVRETDPERRGRCFTCAYKVCIRGGVFAGYLRWSPRGIWGVFVGICGYLRLARFDCDNPLRMENLCFPLTWLMD